MKKIVCVLRPFTMAQNIFVYEDGNKIEVKQTTINAMADMLFELSEKHSVYNIEIVGSKVYAKGIKNQVEKEELSKFNINKLNINII